MKTFIAGLISVGAAIGASSAQAAAPANWTQHLIEHQMKAHPNVASITVAAAPDEKGPLVIVGSTGDASADVSKEQRQVIAEGHPHHTLAASGDLQVTEPLLDVSGNTIGALTIVFTHPTGKAMAAADTAAASIQKALSHHLISVKNTVDPYPYDPAFSEASFAQKLVDQTAAKHPEIIVLATHSTPPGGSVNVISGSTIGRLGKKADEDDTRVIDQGETNLEISEDGKRFEVELPLNDAAGRRIGALGVVLHYPKGADKERLHTHAVAIRDEMARQIPNAAALAEPR